MKKFILCLFVTLLIINVLAQRVKVPAALRNMPVKTPIHQNNEFLSPQNNNVPLLEHSKIYVEDEIGQTYYDLATNISDDNRIFLYPDGTVGITYTFGINAPNYPDRGTGYNYFDGSAWGPIPGARIENVKTGWPSYAPLGPTGEMFISHAFGTALIMCKRDIKGTGAWTQTSLPSVAGYAPGWARICTNGNIIHVLASANAAYLGQTNPIVYFRSQDAGATWDIQAQIPAGLTPADGYSYGFGADVYEWAQPQGNTIAFVIGSKTSDLILMKSADNGDTWTKTVIFQHPYPNWTDAVLTPDTPYVCDGAHAVSLDASGNACVAFGLNRFLNDDTTDGSYSWFPGVDGLAFWKEGDPAFSSANPDDVDAAGKLIGWLQDIDGSGFVLDGYTSTSIASYQVGCTSQPQITINSAGGIFVIYKSLVETMMSVNGQFFNHLWGRYSGDGGLTWCPVFEITSGVDHDQVECVFPAMSKTTDGNLHILYQYDFEPGTSIGSDADPAAMNSYYSIKISNDSLMCINNIKEVNLNGPLNIFPNPVSDKMNIQFSFNKSVKGNLSIYNSLGETIKNGQFVVDRGGVKQIDINDLAKGIYFVKIESEQGIFTKKIIRQ